VAAARKEPEAFLLLFAKGMEQSFWWKENWNFAYEKNLIVVIDAGNIKKQSR